MCAALLVLLLFPAPIPFAQSPARGLPAPLEQYLSKVVLPTAVERKQLLDGMPVAKLVPVTGGNEIAVFGGVWIKSTIDSYVQRLGDIEQFERGEGFKVTKRISAPPQLSDFDALRLPDEDVRDLRTCRVDNCEVKLGEKAVQRFRSEINWKAPDMRPAVDKLMRQLAFEYATGYLAGGNAQLAVFRDSGKPTSVATEFREMVEHMPDLSLWAPDLKRYLTDFPTVTLPNSTSFLYWQETEFGLKPTIRMSHVTIRQAATETIIASRMLYASHYFWTGLELRALLPDPSRGPGFWYVTSSRSRLDGLSGITGTFVRRRVRSEVLKGTLAALRIAKTKMEQPRQQSLRPPSEYQPLWLKAPRS